VPLLPRERLKACFESLPSQHAFYRNDEWFDFLNALAGQAAIAIESSTLFASLQAPILNLPWRMMHYRKVGPMLSTW